MKQKYRVFFNDEMYYLANNQMSEIHLNLNNQHWGLYEGGKRKTICTDRDGILMLYTGFTDDKTQELFDGDIIGDWNEVDNEQVQSNLQIFWNQPTGSWHLDTSMKQDKSNSTELWEELRDFKYEKLGNIYQNR